jgi:hypothetical protein
VPHILRNGREMIMVYCAGTLLHVCIMARAQLRFWNIQSRGRCKLMTRRRRYWNCFQPVIYMYQPVSSWQLPGNYILPVPNNLHRYSANNGWLSVTILFYVVVWRRHASSIHVDTRGLPENRQLVYDPDPDCSWPGELFAFEEGHHLYN